MIGNDIVDLIEAKKKNNWKRQGYLEKIYTPSELKLIHNSCDADTMVWILWSMKEASYKANHRITKIEEYAPKKIECRIDLCTDTIYYGNTTYNGMQYNLQTCVSKEYVLSIALYKSNNFSDLIEIIIRNYPLNYLEILKKKFISQDEYIKKDNNGIPILYNLNRDEIKPISISHHGIFLSVVFLKSRKMSGTEVEAFL